MGIRSGPDGILRVVHGNLYQDHLGVCTDLELMNIRHFELVQNTSDGWGPIKQSEQELVTYWFRTDAWLLIIQ